MIVARVGWWSRGPRHRGRRDPSVIRKSSTSGAIAPSEGIEVVLAIFDLSDSVLDTVILLDNFQWACEGGAPVTSPG
jgi:hypothetical protein